ncbi:MAG: BTAD domain-containing putative transcriptional regulator, partial [Anaerolineales bacterium]
MLAYLLLHPGRHGREKLAALFWGESSDVGARNSLRNALALLNKTVGTGLVLADRQTVEIDPGYPFWVDVFELQEQASILQTEPLTERAEVISALYQGDLLADFYEDWIFPFRDQTRSLMIDSLLLMAQQMRAQSEYARAIDYASQVLAFDAASERAHQHLIFSYMAQGKRSAALQQFERCKEALWEELAVDPSEATLALVDWITQGADEQKPFAAQITNLGLPLTSFIGRKHAMAEIKQQLASTRLITITGSAGGGKT